MLEIDLGTIMKIFGPLYFLSNYLELFDSIFLLFFIWENCSCIETIFFLKTVINLSMTMNCDKESSKLVSVNF